MTKRYVGRFLAALLCLTLALSLLPGGVTAAKAEGETTFSVSNSGNTFTVTRSGDTSLAQTVRYRTVSLSALEGKNFTGKSGTLTFDAGETSKTVTVSETATASVPAPYSYQTGTTRSYRFELLDEGGFKLDRYADRDITYADSYTVSNYSSTVYADRTITVKSSEMKVTDSGYDKNTYVAIPLSSYFGAAAPQAYLSAIGAELRMLIELEAKEADDGYQYIQILANNTSGCDNRSGVSDGDPGNISLSSYMAGFGHDPGDKNATYAKYAFPVTSKGDNCGIAYTPWNADYGNSIGDLYQQKFKTNARATNGRLIVPTNADTLGIRFNASGKNDDDWYVRNITAKIKAESPTPSVKTGDVTVSRGSLEQGNEFYVSIPFNEIVNVSGSPSPRLTTSWGTMYYYAGSGTNVLTFTGTVSAGAGTALTITGMSGTIRNIGQKAFTWSGSVNTGKTVAASTSWPITYDLAGGALPAGQSNPATYTWSTSNTTLKNPERTGYTFDGWTGTGLNAPTVNVSFSRQHVARSYTANWTPVTYSLTCNLQDGALGDGESNPETYTVESDAITLVNPTRFGYNFVGWTGTGLDQAAETVVIPQGSTGDRSYTANWNRIYHTVTLKNEDGTVFDSWFVAHGVRPSGYEIPTKTSTAQYTYAFAGWNDGTTLYGPEEQLPVCLADAEYTAVFTETINQYNVVWKNEDGTVLYTTATPLDYGTVPVYGGSIPYKSGSAQYTYTYNGWTDGTNQYPRLENGDHPVFPAVTGTTVYTATYERSITKYRIQFRNWNGANLWEADFEYGTTPVYGGPEPQRQGDVLKSYTFSGWGLNGSTQGYAGLATVRGPAYYQARFTESEVYYPITLTQPSGQGITISAYNLNNELTSSAGWGDQVYLKYISTDGNGVSAWHVQDANGTDLNVNYNRNNGLPTFTMLENGAVISVETAAAKTVTIESNGRVSSAVLGTYGEVISGGLSSAMTASAAPGASLFLRIQTVAGAEPQSITVASGSEQWEYPITVDGYNNIKYVTFPMPEDDATVTINTVDAAWGDNLTWSLSGGTLTISGTGEMAAAYSAANYPWYASRSQINAIVIEEGVTGIASNAFLFDQSFVNNIWLPGTLTSIGSYAFTPGYSDVWYSGSRRSWGSLKETFGTTTGNEWADGGTVHCQHTVRFVNTDDAGAILQSGPVYEGLRPEYTGETPVMAADAQYTYTFRGWYQDANNGSVEYFAEGTELAAVSAGDPETISYYADYSSSLRSYAIRFLNWDGTEFQSPEVEYGSVPAASEEPRKASDDDHSYDFAGWSDGTTTYADDDELPAVTGPATYTAVFTPVARRYAIRKNPDSHGYVGEIFSDDAHEMTQATAGTVIYVIPDADNGWGIASLRVIDADGNDVPIRMNEDTEFVPAFTMPAGDVTISVTSAEAKSVAVTPDDFVEAVSVIVYGTDYDDPDPSTGNVTGAVAPGAPVTLMMLPDTWSYVAAGRITVTANGSSASYQTRGVVIDGDYCRVVTFAMPNDDVTVTIQDAVIYNVSFVNWDGTELASEMVEENKNPVYAGTPRPTRASTAQYTYTFTGWTDGTANYAADEPLPPATADVTYTATYSSTVNRYDVTFVDEDGTTVLKAATAYDYGTVRSEIALPADPTKTQDAQYTYAFAGWTPEITAVTADATYTATYTATPRLYTVAWLDGDGNTLKTESMAYGEWPEYSGNTPTKTATAQRRYTFNNAWLPDVTEVTGDATYTAQFDEEIGLRVGDTEFTVPARDSIYTFFTPAETGYYRISVLMNGEVTGFIGDIVLYSDADWQGDNSNSSYIFNRLIKLTAGELYHLRFQSYSDEPVEPTVRIARPEVRHVYVSSAARHAEIEPSLYTDYSGFEWIKVAEPGDKIYLRAYPDTGYSLTEWSVTCADGQPVELRYEQGAYSYYPCFTMPAQDVTVGATVTMAETYPVNVRCRTGQYTGRYCYVNGAYTERNKEAPAGARVTLRLYIYSYYQQTIKNFTVTGQSGDVPFTVEQAEPNEYNEIYWAITFTMPDEPVTVSMDVKKENLPEVSTALRTGANTVPLSPWLDNDGYAVAYGSFTPEISGNYQFTVTGGSESGSVIAYQREQDYYEYGWKYLDDLDDDTVSVRAGETLLLRLYDNDEVTNLTLTVTRAGDVDRLHTISVDPGITHGIVTLDSTEAEYGENVYLYPEPEPGYILSGLTVTAADGEAVEAESMESCFRMPDSNVTVSATFAQAYPITVTENGHAEAKIMYVTTPNYESLYAMYTNVGQYQAFPGSTAYLLFETDEGYRLTGVAVTAADGTPVECQFDQGDISMALFTMPSQPVTVTMETALYATETLNLGVNANPKAGWYLFTPAESGEYTFAFEGNHTLTVYDTEGNFLSYVGTWYSSSVSLAGGRTWLVKVSRDVLGDDGSYYLGSDLTITRTGNAKGVYSVTVDPAISGGTVTPNYTQAMPYEWIALTVTPDAGYRLDSLTVTAGSRTLETAEEDGVYWFRMPESDATVTATFALDQLPEYGPATFTLPAALTTVGESAFEGNPLMTVVDAGHCTSIGKWAFKDSGVTQIRLPQACDIAPDAFDGCGTVYVFAPAGGTTQAYCDQNTNPCVFVEMANP